MVKHLSSLHNHAIDTYTDKHSKNNLIKIIKASQTVKPKFFKILTTNILTEQKKKEGRQMHM